MMVSLFYFKSLNLSKILAINLFVFFLYLIEIFPWQLLFDLKFRFAFFRTQGNLVNFDFISNFIIKNQYN